MYKLMLVEDDPTIVSVLTGELTRWGYEVVCPEDLGHVDAAFRAQQPHLVLLDISLPFFNGFHWCSEIRRTSKVPILFLSSASDNMNIVIAMNMGGDDFVAKPFDMNVLLAKIQAMLRRSYDFGAPEPVLECRGAVLDPKGACLTYCGQRLPLTKNENRILLTLLERKGQIVSRDVLMQRLWETDSFVDENTLTVNVARLRKKLDGIGLPELIVTKKGAGYLIEEADS